MAYRMACDHADAVAAIVSLAGSTWLDPSKCAPTEPVSVLQIHGTDDDAVPYEGRVDYPGAEATLSTWADYNGCAATRTADGTLDLDSNVAGAETAVERHDACPTGVAVELWTIEGGGHVPALDSNFAGLMWSWYSGPTG